MLHSHIDWWPISISNSNDSDCDFRDEQWGSDISVSWQKCRWLESGADLLKCSWKSEIIYLWINLNVGWRVFLPCWQWRWNHPSVCVLIWGFKNGVLWGRDCLRCLFSILFRFQANSTTVCYAKNEWFLCISATGWSAVHLLKGLFLKQSSQMVFICLTDLNGFC